MFENCSIVIRDNGQRTLSMAPTVQPYGLASNHDKIKRLDSQPIEVGPTKRLSIRSCSFPQMKFQEISILPRLGSASASNAAGEKSRSFMAHPGQRSTTVAVTDFPWTIEKVHVKKLLDQWELEKYIQFAVMRFPQRGLLRQIINERALINV